MEEPVPTAVERSFESVIDNIADPKRRSAMQRFRDAVFEKLSRSRSCNLTPALKSLLERRLLQIIPDFHIPTHPTYALMILTAISKLNDEGGSTEEAISSFIKTEYNDLPLGHKSLLTRHLSRMCNRGDICVDEERRFKIPNLGKNGTEETKGEQKKGFSRGQGRSRRKGMRRRKRESILSGEENQLKRQMKEQASSRVVQLNGKQIVEVNESRECLGKMGAVHTKKQIKIPEPCTSSDLARSLDQNVQLGVKEPIGLQIQSEIHQNQSVEGENQPQEQLDATAEHYQYGSCPEEVKTVLTELNESRELKNDIIVEKSLALEQIMCHRRKRTKRKYQHTDGKSLESQGRAKRFQMLANENESGSGGPSIERYKGQRGEIGVGQEENQQRLQVELMEAKSHEKEQLNVNEEGDEGDANGEQKQSDGFSVVANEQTHMPQLERLEVIKVQEQTRYGGTQLGKENMVNEESQSLKEHSKIKETESCQKETAVVAFYRRTKRPTNIVKEQLSGGLLSVFEKNQQRAMGEGREQARGMRCPDDTKVDELVGQDQLKSYGNKHIGEKHADVTTKVTMLPAVTTVDYQYVEGQSRSLESRPCKDSVAEEGSGSLQLLKGGKLKKNRRIPVVVLALRQSRRLQDKEKGEKPDGKCYELPKGKRPQARVQSVKQDDIGKAGKPVMSASKTQPELETDHQETPEQQVDVGVERNREEMQIEVNNEQFDEQEREGGGLGKLELACKRKVRQDKAEGKAGTDGTSLCKRKRHQKNPRTPSVALSLRHSTRLQDKEGGEGPEGQCCKLIKEKNLQRLVQRENKGNKKRPGKPVKSAASIQPKEQRHQGEQTVAQEWRIGASLEQNEEEKQMKGQEEELEEQEKVANEPQNLGEKCQVKEATADKKEAAYGNEDILEIVLDADDECYNPRRFEHNVKIYRRRSVQRKENGSLILRI